MERVWNYGGRAYDFDITEAACVSRMTKALAMLKQDTAAWEDRWLDGKQDDSMVVEHCASIRRFFDGLFGEGEGGLITGGADSAAVCDEAYLDFLCFAQMQIDVFTRIREEVEARYQERLERMAGRYSSAEQEGRAADDGDSH